MDNDNQNENDNSLIGYEGYRKELIFINKIVSAVLFISIPIFFILQQFFSFEIPSGLLITFSVFALVVPFYVYLLSKKIREVRDMENFCTWFFFVSVLLYTSIIHYLGGIEGIGAVFYPFILIPANIILSRKKAIFITVTAIISYAVLGFLEYFDVIPHTYLFLTGPALYNNLSYLFFAIGAGAVFGFFYSGLVANSLASTYKQRNDALKKERKDLFLAQAELREAKKILEKKVEGRKEELKALKKNLEEKVRKRTKELKDKIRELGRFHDIAAGRELRMEELKEELKKIK